MALGLTRKYEGSRDVKLCLESTSFWDTYHRFQRQFFISLCHESKSEKFVENMHDFCQTTDPEDFVRLYEMLYLHVQCFPPEPAHLKKYQVGLDKVSLEQSLSEIRKLVRTYLYHMPLEEGMQVFVVTRSGTGVLEFPDMGRSTAMLATMSEVPTSSAGKKKARRQHMREMQIRTGQRRR